MCVCVCKREREREFGKGGMTLSARLSECMSACPDEEMETMITLERFFVCLFGLYYFVVVVGGGGGRGAYRDGISGWLTMIE